MNESKPLAGKFVIVSRPEHQASSLALDLEALGARVAVVPAVSIHPPQSWDGVDAALEELESFDIIIFTSVNGVRFFSERLAALGLQSKLSADCILAAIGPATAKMLTEKFRRPDIVPDEFVSEAIEPALGEVSGKRILLPRADIARKDLSKLLRKRGADVQDVAVYRVLPGESDLAKQRLAELSDEPSPDFITVTSSSTATGIISLLRSSGKSRWLTDARFACIGPITARTVLESGYPADLVAARYTSRGIVDALLQEIQNEQDT